jgi:hypothetical protein
VNTLYLLNESKLTIKEMPKYLLYLHLVYLNDPYNILPKYLLYLYLYEINIDIRLPSYLVYLKSIWMLSQNNNYYGLHSLLYIWIVRKGKEYNFKVDNNTYVKILKFHKPPKIVNRSRDVSPPRRRRSSSKSSRQRYLRDRSSTNNVAIRKPLEETPYSKSLAVKSQNKCVIS